MAAQVDGQERPRTFRIELVQPPSPKKTVADRLKDVGIIGLVGAVLAALFGTAFQYSRWLVEQQLARNADDFKIATHTFNTLAEDLAKAQTLQETLYFTYRDALTPDNPEHLKFLRQRAAAIYVLYEAQRLAMRQRMDSLLFDVQRHLDWASAPQFRDLAAATGASRDPLSYGRLKQAKFDCLDKKKSIPHFPDQTSLGIENFGTFDVDWRSIKHHLIVYNFCFRQIHDEIEAIRVWAALPDSTDMRSNGVNAEGLAQKLDNNVQRLNGISMLGLIQVERVRELNTPPGVLHFLKLAVTGTS